MVITILQRDPRCTMITLEPETGVGTQRSHSRSRKPTMVRSVSMVRSCRGHAAQGDTIELLTKSSHTTLAHWAACVTV